MLRYRYQSCRKFSRNSRLSILKPSALTFGLFGEGELSTDERRRRRRHHRRRRRPDSPPGRVHES